MTDVKNNDITKVVSMTQVEFQLELDKARLEQKAIDDDHLREVKKMVVDKACLQYEKELRQMKRILNEIKDDAGKLISVGGSLIQFRKAMEE